MERSQEKKNIWYWTLYDFANSMATIVFFLYFAQWLVIDKGVSDFWFNMIFVGSTILLIFTAPAFGILSDQKGVQKPYLRNVTWLTFAAFLATGIITLFFSNQVLLAAFAFLAANYFYQLSFTFYNALLVKLAPPERRGFISGIGQAGNWIGEIVGLVVTIPLVGGAVYFFGEPGRAQAFLLPTMLFLIFALPMMYWFKEKKTVSANTETWNYQVELQRMWSRFVAFCKLPGIGIFLLGYFFFNDAILTVQNNFPIYLERVFHVADMTKSMLIMGILATAAIGALISGWATKKIGLKRTLLIVLGCWVVILPVLAVVTVFPVFVVLTILIGFLFGAVWTVTRTVMVHLTPNDQMNYGMGYYTLAERFATFVGPLSWGIITSALVGMGDVRYRIAMAVMGVFVLIGFLIVRKIRISDAGVIS